MIFLQMDLYDDWKIMDKHSVLCQNTAHMSFGFFFWPWVTAGGPILYPKSNPGHR